MAANKCRWSWGFIVKLLSLGILAGFLLQNGPQFFQSYIEEMANASLVINEENLQLNPRPSVSSKAKVAVANRDDVLKKHPLYSEIEKLDREIFTRTLEQSSYNETFTKWQSQEVIADPKEFLEKQSKSVTEAVAKSTNELLLQKSLEIEAEKLEIINESRKYLQNEKEKIIDSYRQQLVQADKDYQKELEALNKRLQVLDAQTKYSIRVDIGLSGQRIHSSSKDNSQIETLTSIEKEILEKEEVWLEKVFNLKEEQNRLLNTLETKENLRVAQRVQELELKYREDEKRVFEEMEREVDAVEKRRSDLSKALLILDGDKFSSYDELIDSFTQMQRRQLENLIARREKLYQKIEAECVEGLRVLAIKSGFLPGTLVTDVPSEAYDLTKELLDLLYFHEDNEEKEISLRGN